jgi:hypothetical protein
MIALAFIPFYDPLPALFPNLDEYWLWLVVPLVVAISLVYKGTRIEHLRRLPWEATIMSVQILMLMVVAAILLASGYWAAIRVL